MVVMESEILPPKPSASHVGQEFVRQYYTLLNRAPKFIHRFYGKQSSYVRGETYNNGEPEKPAIGQEEIRKKIESLDFQDCRTKIKQVDAHPTVGKSVVVQVTGEISNKELPLRRFMQTFVLAPQGDNPCKFYVHNDIFRYQDVVFMDEPYMEPTECVQVAEEQQQEAIEVDDEAVVYVEAPAESESVVADVLICNEPITNGVDQHDEEVSQVMEQVVAASEQPISEQPPAPAASAPECPVESPVSSAEATVSEPSSPESTPEPEVQEANVQEQVEAVAQSPAPVETQSPPTPSPAAPAVQEPASPVVVVSELPPVTEVPPKNFSWADITSKNTNRSPSSVPPQPVAKVAPPPQPQHQPPPPSEPVDPVESSPQQQMNQRPQHHQQRGPPRPNHRNNGGQYMRQQDDDRQDNSQGGGYQNRRMQQGPNGGMPPRYPDNQQIFVGNLTPDINESDLRNHFAGFGQVIDVRINYSHTHNPNFGFVIFEDPKSVEEVLRILPNQMKSVRINIEEKKQRRNDHRRNNGGAGGDGYQRRNPNNMNMRRNNNNNGGGMNMMRRDRDRNHHSREGGIPPQRQQGGNGGYNNNQQQQQGGQGGGQRR